MAEEFQESEVVFSARYKHRDSPSPSDGGFGNREVIEPPQRKNESKKNEMAKKMARSLPVNVPEIGLRRSGSDDRLEEECDDEEMLPPHLIVARRASRKLTSSVQTGNGRTLKGRDLKQVRNSILRMTGFLEKEQLQID